MIYANWSRKSKPGSNCFAWPASSATTKCALGAASLLTPMRRAAIRYTLRLPALTRKESSRFRQHPDERERRQSEQRSADVEQACQPYCGINHFAIGPPMRTTDRVADHDHGYDGRTMRFGANSMFNAQASGNIPPIAIPSIRRSASNEA